MVHRAAAPVAGQVAAGPVILEGARGKLASQMSADPNKKSARSFQCRDVLWETFEQMARELECSVDYLINEAMKQYARQRSSGGARTPYPAPGRPADMPPQSERPASVRWGVRRADAPRVAAHRPAACLRRPPGARLLRQVGSVRCPRLIPGGERRPVPPPPGASRRGCSPVPRSAPRSAPPPARRSAHGPAAAAARRHAPADGPFGQRANGSPAARRPRTGRTTLTLIYQGERHVGDQATASSSGAESSRAISR